MLPNQMHAFGALVLSFMALLTPFQARSANACSDLFLKKNLVKDAANPFAGFKVEGVAARFHVVGSGISAKQVREFDTSLVELQSFLGALTPPARPDIDFRPVTLTPAALDSSNWIEIGLRFGFKASNLKVYLHHPRLTIPFLTHEYSHLVFATNLVKHVPEYGEILDVIRKFESYGEKEAELSLKKFHQTSALNSAKDDAEKARVQREIENTEREAQSLREESERYERDHFKPAIKAREVVTPYNELFADVAAVLHAERPDAMARSYHFARADQTLSPKRVYREVVDQRNFDKHVKTTAEVNGPHEYFGDVRRFIWESYLASPTILKTKKSEVLESVFSAIAKEYRFRLENPKIDPVRDRGAMNERLIEQIKLELSARNIESLK